MKKIPENLIKIENEYRTDIMFDGEDDSASDAKQEKLRIKQWITSLLQSENLSLLVGSGLTIAVSNICGISSAGMDTCYEVIPETIRDSVKKRIKESASTLKRGKPNIEDQIRVMSVAEEGLRAIGGEKSADAISKGLEKLLEAFYNKLVNSEKELKAKLYKNDEGSNMSPMDYLVAFLSSFAFRSASRERLNIFTTNYERLLEHACDHAGIRVIDRFVGMLEPLFRSSRLELDVHYNPPGIRGEPRYLDGVVKLCKLHGSLDWRYDPKLRVIKRTGIPFGSKHEINSDERVMIYPNSAKDRETAEYPYVDLFRDFAAAVCKPNSTLCIYGYGFGDEHINRIIEDMLTIPSAHLLIISHGDESGRIKQFYDNCSHKSQISLLIGKQVGDLKFLVEELLPLQSIDRILEVKHDTLKKKGETVKTEITEQGVPW